MRVVRNDIFLALVVVRLVQTQSGRVKWFFSGLYDDLGRLGSRRNQICRLRRGEGRKKCAVVRRRRLEMALRLSRRTSFVDALF